jgi:hypothetical protein
MWRLALVILAVVPGCGLVAAMPRRISVTSAAIPGLSCTAWRASDLLDPGSEWITCFDKDGEVVTPYATARTNLLGQLFSGVGVSLAR